MKILVVSYLPKEAQSRTKRLLDTFCKGVKQKDDIEMLDLVKDEPDFVTPGILQAYIQRNYMGQELSPELQKEISKFDRMTKQFKSADIIVMAFPMYNFSLPGAIKAYFDSVMLKGETFDTGEKGFVGLMKGKKALVLFTSGGDHTGKNSMYDYITNLTTLELEFMGFSDIRVISAQGVDMQSLDTEVLIVDAQKEIKGVVKDWGL